MKIRIKTRLEDLWMKKENKNEQKKTNISMTKKGGENKDAIKYF